MNAAAHPKSGQSRGEHWTAQRIEELTTRWCDGESATMIAVAMHTSRNAILGKSWRLGLRRAEIIPLPPRQRAGHRIPRRDDASAKPCGNGRAKPVDDAPAVFAKPKPFHQLAAGDCHWPGEDGQFCAAPVIDGKSYCLAHCRAAYVKPYARMSFR